MAGHRFTKDDPNKPKPGPNTPGSGFSDLEKMIGNDLNNRFNPGGYGPGGMGGFGGGGQNFNNNPYQNIDPKGFMGGNGGNPNNFGPNGGNPNNFGPNAGNQQVGGGGNMPPGGYTPPPPPNTGPANLGPDFFVPV